MVHFTVVCLVAKSSNMSEARGDVVMIQSKPCCFQMQINYFVIMPTTSRYWSLSQHGHLQPHSNQRLCNEVHNCKMAL